MTKFYEVRCSATAEIVELWRVKARNEDEAIELVDSGHGEFVAQTGCDNEEDRRDWWADEIGADKWAALSDDGYALANAAPAMLAALENLLRQIVETSAYDDARKGDDPGLLNDVAEARAAIAAATGTPTGEGGHPIPAAQPYHVRHVSTIIRKSWEPRFAIFDSEEDLRADLLEYARDVLEIEGLADEASIADLANAIIDDCGDQVYLGEC